MMSYDPIMSRIRDALNARKYRSYSEALEAYRKNKSNAITLEGGFLLKYHLQLRGFVVQTPEFPRREFPVCPVYGCSGYAAGGHSCRHAMEFVKSLTEPVVTVKEEVEPVKSVPVNKSKLTEMAFHDLLVTLAKEVDVDYSRRQPFSDKEWTAILRVAAAKGTIEHSFSGITISFFFTKFGQMYYKKLGGSRFIYKCPLPNCLKGILGGKIDKDGGSTTTAFLCERHQNRLNDLQKLVRLINN